VTARRRLLLSIIIALLLLPAIAYWLADSWLESAGGREVLQRALSDRLGMPVELRGEFNIMLLPEPGVSGTELVVGGAGVDEVFISNKNYQLAVALRPLFEKRLLIRSVRLEGGVVYPENFSRSTREQADASAGSGFSPEIERFLLEDFQLNLPGESATQILVRELAFSEFAAGRPTPFSLVTEGFGQLEGEVTWSDGGQLLDLEMDWAGQALGSATLTAQLHLPDKTGGIDLQYLPWSGGSKITLEASYLVQAEALMLPYLRLAAAGQSISGEGCLLQGETAALNLVMKASVLNLDSFQAMLPETISGGGSSNGKFPLQLNLRLSVSELSAQGAVAHGAVLHVGEEPDCL